MYVYSEVRFMDLNETYSQESMSGLSDLNEVDFLVSLNKIAPLNFVTWNKIK